MVRANVPPLIGWRDLEGTIHGLETLGVCTHCGAHEPELRGNVVCCDECGTTLAVILPGRVSDSIQ
jgi:hypothetical protein